MKIEFKENKSLPSLSWLAIIDKLMGGGNNCSWLYGRVL